MEIVVAKNILNANDQIAAELRARFDAAGVYVINVVGSPGSGKTTLLEALLGQITPLKSGVIQGDLATTLDAERIDAMGIPCVQINTGQGCHLDARMIAEALGKFDLEELDVLVIENVGNLVCTAGFNLGEHLRLVVLSVAEGDDKIDKYPPMFRSAGAVVLGKTDLLPFTNFDMAKAKDHLGRLKEGVPIFELSARTGEGIGALAKWLIAERPKRSAE